MEKKFYPCKDDYQDLEDEILGRTEVFEKLLLNPNTFKISFYQPEPVYPQPYPFESPVYPQPYPFESPVYPQITWVATPTTTTDPGFPEIH